jgi:3-isopropylmalate dehydrogenase
MSAYGNLRPCFFASDALVDSSPLKADVCRGTDFVIVRELTGGIYFGERQEDDGSGYAWDKEPYSRPEVERVARLAGFLARGRGDKKVMSLDKANVLATSRLWRNVMTETFEREFPDLKVEHQLIDSAAMIMVKNPTALNGVVVTSNLFGDIVSDEASVIPGSIGLLPSGSLSGIPDGKGKCNGIYEPIHGKFSFFSFFFFFFPFKFPIWSFVAMQPLLTGTQKRLCTRHLRQGHRQPHWHHPLCGHDAPLLSQPTRRGQGCRRRRQGCHRWWPAHKGHGRQRWHGTGWRRGCCTVDQDSTRLGAKRCGNMKMVKVKSRQRK